MLDLDDLIGADHTVGANEGALTDPPLNADRSVVAGPEDHFDQHARHARFPGDTAVHLRTCVCSTIERVGFIHGIRSEHARYHIAKVIDRCGVWDRVVDKVSCLGVIGRLRDGDRANVLVGNYLGVAAHCAQGPVLGITRRWRGRVCPSE